MNSSLGQKRQCTKCATKFYDLGAVPAICPKCKTTQAEAPAPKRKVAAVPKKVVKKPRKAESLPGMDGMEAVVELEELDDFEDLEVLGEVEEHQEESATNPNSDDAEDEMFMGELAESDTKLVDTLDEADPTDEDEDPQPDE